MQKINSFLLFLVALVTFASPALAKNFGENGRLYLPKENIALHNNQILIGKNGRWISVDQLSADEKGFYILNCEKNYSFFRWECPKCGAENWFWDDACWVCGYEPK
jgi:hypothetical protein